MDKPEVLVCMGSSCFARGNERNLDTICKFLEARKLRDEVDLRLNCCLCQGNCGEGPNVMINGVRHRVTSQGVMLDILNDLFRS